MSDCETCGGEGKLVHRLPASKTWRDIGGGLQLRDAGGFSSELCECRKSLPPRDGEARWWMSRTETIAELQFAMFDEQAVVSLTPEVPVRRDNYVVHRTGDNVYYPVSVQLSVTSWWLGLGSYDEGSDFWHINISIDGQKRVTVSMEQESRAADTTEAG